MKQPEVFDLWTWEKSKEVVKTLPGRLGFPPSDTLKVLDLEINLIDGTIQDTTKQQPFDPTTEYIFFLLSRYAAAKEVPLTGTPITFRNVSGGRAYAPVFEGRVVMPLLHHLGNEPETFTKAAKALGGQAIKLGDVAYNIPAFPLVPITYVLWLADSEFPARVKVFLDSTVGSFLDAEAITHLAALTTLRFLVVAGKK